MSRPALIATFLHLSCGQPLCLLLSDARYRTQTRRPVDDRLSLHSRAWILSSLYPAPGVHSRPSHSEHQSGRATCSISGCRGSCALSGDCQRFYDDVDGVENRSTKPGGSRQARTHLPEASAFPAIFALSAATSAFVFMEATTERPGRKTLSRMAAFSTRIRTGTRRALLSLPVAFSEGSSEYCERDTGAMLSTVPRNTRPPAAPTTILAG